MSSDFKIFGSAVRKRFDELAKDRLFKVNIEADLLWRYYLAAFPEGSNPLYRERSEHDCSCCKNFIRQMGMVVGIQNGALATIWDVNDVPAHYQHVANSMSEVLKAGSIINDVFLTKETKYGLEKNIEVPDDPKTIIKQWHHFHCDIPKQHQNREPDTIKGALRTNYETLWRAIREIKPEAVETVLDLIKGNSLYRGDTYKDMLVEFQRTQQRVRSVLPVKAQLLCWSLCDASVAKAHIKNTSIGQLLTNLSNGDELEEAVKKFDTMVAPQNYKRTTALVSKRDIENALKTIDTLGLESALERRHARLSDVSVNNVLFVDNAVQGEMRGGLKDLLMKEVKQVPFNKDGATAISIDDFVAKVLPKATGIKLHLDNKLMPNFVSMTAPVHAEVKPLFKWGNSFGWSYDGNVTDSIKQRVKDAGGKVEGNMLRVSLAWSNTDDLDLHVQEPAGGDHIYFGNKVSVKSGGRLDVDMNVSATTRTPVENIRWASKLMNGQYKVWVNQFTKRESIDVGFTVEIEAGGKVHTLSYAKGMPARSNQPVADIAVRGMDITVTPVAEVTHGERAQEKWGLKTLDLVRVNSVVLSPNYWDCASGLQHWFFILDKCENPLPTRGIYNEFLTPELEKHRKVFEILGDKTKCPPASDQLSGVGFSQARGDSVSVVVMGPRLNKTYTIMF